MRPLNRRDFGKLLGGVSVAAAGTSVGSVGGLAQATAPSVATGARPRVVVIGGGAGGGTIAHVLRRGTPEIEVTLIEPQRQYTTCFFSNLYIGGFRSLESITHDYSGLTSIGVRVIHDTATGIDVAAKSVALQGGQRVPYDRLVVSPGIDFKHAAIPGFSQAAEQIMPHAYKAGAQTKLLVDQLQAMPDGGTVVIAPPQNPYRCPPGPYERACMVAHFIKTQKPKSKLVILDPKRAISKQALFVEAFEEMYKGIVEFHLSTEIDNFALKRVDPKTMEIEAVSGLKIKAAVANIIPPQQAGRIAQAAGLTDGDWCPIDPENFMSRKFKDIYVIGDASMAGDMPKSAFSANSQAKSVSNDIEAALAEKPKYPPRYRNTCWSMTGPASSVKIGGFYAPKDGQVKAVSSFVSAAKEDPKARGKSLKESQGWYAGIVAEAFNKRVDTI
jgi:NADPH-dependent 2,4-dienoyl-CoA reductase/sulfur reductase-like enzyme